MNTINRTKIIATVGPGCDDESVMQSLVDGGVSCFRINLSHGTEDQKRHYFNLVKSLKTPSGLRPSILADIAGPKIRVKDLKDKINVLKGESIVLSNDSSKQNAVSISKGVRFEKVNPGARILIDDGRLSLEVKELVSNQTIDCIAIDDGSIENGKGVNFPGIALNLSLIHI